MLSFDITQEDADAIRHIVSRFTNLIDRSGDGADFAPMDLIMDLTACHANGCPLDLVKFQNADDVTLGHDVLGIHCNIDHETGELENCFVPRCALNQ